MSLTVALALGALMLILIGFAIGQRVEELNLRVRERALGLARARRGARERDNSRR